MSEQFVSGELKGNRYKVIDRIGAGGMGVVYRAIDRLTGTFVALKEVNTVPGNLTFASADTSTSAHIALANEFQILASLRHPNIVSVLDYGFDEQRRPYFTMDLLINSVKITEAADDQLFEKQVHLLIQMLQALAYLHQRHIIHRDIKPANIQVTPDGEVKVLDFGLAMSVEYAKQQTDNVSGTLAYIAPEVLQGRQVSVASDLYACGVIAYEVLSGSYPYSSASMMGTINDILLRTPEMSVFTPPLAKVLARLLAKDPADRYTDTDTVIQELSAAAGYPLPVETVSIRESYLQGAAFTGRDDELQRLDNLLRETLQGKGATCLVGGESGVGKSRLLNELRVKALVRNVVVLRGQAVTEGGSPYRVWQNVLRWLSVMTKLTDLEASVLKTIIPDIDTVLQVDVTPAPELTPLAERERTAIVVTDLFVRQTKPLVVLLEDLQWAGDESLVLLNTLARALENRPILFLGSYRDDEAPSLPAQVPHAQVMTVERLPPEQIARLSESILGQVGRAPQIVEFLQRETEGNVFFLIEAVRVLAGEAGERRKIGDMPLPASVTSGGIVAIVRQRLERVPETAQPLLQLAAIRGREIDAALLRNLMPEVDLGQWLLICSNAVILEADESRWRFSHDKLREYILRELERQPEHLKQLHRQVAQAIETIYPDNPNQIVALAHHWTQADVPEKASYYNEMAAQQMMRSGNHQALQYIETAMTYDSRVGELPPTRLALRYAIAGLTHYVLGNQTEATDNLEKSLRYMNIPAAPDKTWKVILAVFQQVGVQIAHRLMPGRYVGVRDSSWFVDNMMFGMLTLPNLYQARGNMLKVLYSVLTSLNTLESFKPSTVASPVMGYTSIHFALGTLSFHRLARYYRQLALDILNDEQQAPLVPRSHQAGAQAQMALYDLVTADWELAVTRLQEAIRFGEELAEINSVELASYYLGFTYECMGKFEEAARVFQKYYEISRRRESKDTNFLFYGALVPLLLRMNRLSPETFDDYDLITDTAAATQRYGDLFTTNAANEALYFAIQANYYAQNAKMAEAWQALQRADIPGNRKLERNYAFFDLYDFMARACVMLTGAAAGSSGDVTAVLRRTIKSLKSFSRSFTFGQPSTALYQGWLAYYEQDSAKAQAAWNQALTRAVELQMPYPQALAHAALAQLDAGGQHRQQADQLFRQLGVHDEVS